MNNTVFDIITDAQNRNNKGITFISGANDETYVSYHELYEKSIKVLGMLQKKGLKKNDELILQITDNTAFIQVFWACILGGIIPVPLSIGYNSENKLKVIRIWKILNNPFIISDLKNLTSLQEIAESHISDAMSNKSILLNEIQVDTDLIGELMPPKPDDIAFIQFSSGTTGDPKGVVLTHENLTTNLSALNDAWGTTDVDSSLSWMPLTHDMGLIAVHLASTLKKIQQYIIPTSVFIRRPSLWLMKADEHRITQLYSPNFGFKFFLDHYKKSGSYNWDLSCVRLIANGAEPISALLCNNFLQEMSQFELNAKALNTVYGLAEATVAVSVPKVGELFVPVNVDRASVGIGQKVREIINQEKSITFVEVGTAVNNCVFRICDDLNNVLKDGYVGLIQIKGDNVTSGYYNNESATKDILTPDGWLNTGDIGFIREGSLVVTGRSKDIIIKNGQNYYAHDIERIAENVKEVELGNVVACGVYNEVKGEEDIVLFFRCKKSFNMTLVDQEIKKVISQQLGLEVHQIIPVRKILKTTSGKVQRGKMKEYYKDYIN
ncbi:AMP-binding protein [Bacillus sp. HU-1818]|uniref:AMP-binding protein n=1 Tax=Bacillus sp. HU-1818 TaxID=2704469 RepID=UPI001F5C6109|nr:AMP-binding protein [Bacillus sp. HU-1818]MCI3196091.1 AMP-binding protein [Bacillus sp. HU-1818]